MNWKKIGIASAVAGAIGVGSFFAVSASDASGAIHGSPTSRAVWSCVKADGSVKGLNYYDGTGAYPRCPAGSNIRYWAQTGPAGPKGAKGDTGDSGASATLTVSAEAHVSGRLDSGAHGDWATDAMTRTVTVTRQHASAVAKCGPTAAQCWFYTGTLTDQGSFRTDDGALSPNSGVAISGNVTGTMTGGSHIEFYANSDTPAADNMPSVVTGNDIPTGAWARQLFDSGTVFSGDANLTDWSWTYDAGNTCERWVDAYNNGAGTGLTAGDIQGVNHCTS